MKKTGIFLGLLLSFMASSIADAQQIIVGNDTTILLDDSVHYSNGSNSYTNTYQLPSIEQKYETILLHYQIKCPTDGCDPWARIATINVVHNGEDFEIARMGTRGSTGGCDWVFDVTDYRSILIGNTTIRSDIFSSFYGHVLNTSLEFIGGKPIREAYRVENLWGNTPSSRWEVGNPDAPLSDHLPTKTIQTDANADSLKARVIMTGHGIGNTNDAAAFLFNEHSLVVDQVDTL